MPDRPPDQGRAGTTTSRIWTEVDLDRTGKQIGALNIEHSVTRSAYGIIEVPIVVIRNGSGPSVLLMAGNHGDEYEGQIVLSRLVHAIEPAGIQGRLIILPAANLPAVLAGTRTSPIDEGNLNRSFPGDPVGSATACIAHYIASVLMPACQVFLDLHSGGSSLLYLPHAYADLSGEPDLDARRVEALEAFNAPIGVRVDLGRAVRKGLAAETALAHGLISLSGEFGGGASVSAPGMRIAERGLHRLLAHLGVIAPDARWSDRQRSRSMRADRSMFVYAPEDGVFEPAHQLGAEISAGDAAGWLHFPERPERAALPLHFRASGLLACLRAIGRARRGDCLAHLFADVTEENEGD